MAGPIVLALSTMVLAVTADLHSLSQVESQQHNQYVPAPPGFLREGRGFFHEDMARDEAAFGLRAESENTAPLREGRQRKQDGASYGENGNRVYHKRQVPANYVDYSSHEEEHSYNRPQERFRRQQSTEPILKRLLKPVVNKFPAEERIFRQQQEALAMAPKQRLLRPVEPANNFPRYPASNERNAGFDNRPLAPERSLLKKAGKKAPAAVPLETNYARPERVVQRPQQPAPAAQERVYTAPELQPAYAPAPERIYAPAPERAYVPAAEAVEPKKQKKILERNAQVEEDQLEGESFQPAYSPYAAPPQAYDTGYQPVEQRGIEAAVAAGAQGYRAESYEEPQRLSFQIHGQEGPHSYRFGYDTGIGYNRQFRYEERDNNGVLHGRYGYYDQEGKLQIVNYTADPVAGFHAEGEGVPKPQY